MSSWSIVSDVFGWLYVVSWGLLSYPQIYLNFKLKSVEGFKLDYPFLNVSGFAFYSLAYTFAYFDAGFPDNNYGLGNVRLNDVIFAYHNLCASIFMNIQAIIYERGANRLTNFSLWLTAITWTSAIAVYFLTQASHTIPITEGFNILEYLGYMKIAITLTKYVPLAYWNYSRKSTQGFSILFVMFDFFGGLFSVSQLLIDYIQGFTSTLNPIKLGLGVICMSYDLLLMYQHYFLYGKRSSLNNTKDSDFYVKEIDYPKAKGSEKQVL